MDKSTKDSTQDIKNASFFSWSSTVCLLLLLKPQQVRAWMCIFVSQAVIVWAQLYSRSTKDVSSFRSRHKFPPENFTMRKGPFKSLKLLFQLIYLIMSFSQTNHVKMIKYYSNFELFLYLDQRWMWIVTTWADFIPNRCGSDRNLRSR